MSDVMLHGVLNMPPELWSGSPIDVMQRHSRYIQASQYIYELDAELTSAREEIAILKSKYAELHLEAEIKDITKQRDLLQEMLEIVLNATVLNHRKDRWHIDAEYALHKIKLNKL